MKEGFTVFFTGLSGSGKTTLAKALCKKLNATLIDGDEIRKTIKLGFSKKDRIRNIKRAGAMAKQVMNHGGIAVCSLIAPYEEARSYNRRRLKRYVEVYLSTNIDVCMARDVKGLYKRGTKNMTGLDDPYEVPKHPEIVIDTNGVSVEECIETILTYLSSTGLYVS